jgi:hypothetical protein
VVVDVVLPAVLGLVLVREAGVEACHILSAPCPLSPHDPARPECRVGARAVKLGYIPARHQSQLRRVQEQEALGACDKKKHTRHELEGHGDPLLVAVRHAAGLSLVWAVNGSVEGRFVACVGCALAWWGCRRRSSRGRLGRESSSRGVAAGKSDCARATLIRCAVTQHCELGAGFLVVPAIAHPHATLHSPLPAARRRRRRRRRRTTQHAVDEVPRREHAARSARPQPAPLPRQPAPPRSAGHPELQDYRC